MGRKKVRQLDFLSRFPVCCLCGGNTPATTRDHLPPKAIFTSHKWPEEYEFPACGKCNSDSSSDDAIFAMISRINAGRDNTKQETEEWRKQLRAFNELHPGEGRKLLLSANEKRRMLRLYNIAKPPGIAYGELPILRFTPLIHRAVERVSRKLILALHYRHSGQIVPSDAWVQVLWRTNVHRIANDFPEEIFGVFHGRVELRRDRKSLGDQFDYQFGVSDDGQLGGYIAAFRKVFFVIRLVVFDASQMNETNEEELRGAVQEGMGGIDENAAKDSI